MAWRVREHKHCKNWASFCLRFSLPPVFRWNRFCGHTKCLLFFFRCAHRKRNSRNLVCPQNRILRKTWGGRKTHAESRFIAMLEISMASSSGFLILCLCNFLLWLAFIKLFCAKLFLIIFWMHVLHFFLLESNIKCLTLKEKSAKRVFKNISGRV